VTKVAATLGITKELTEYIMEDLGDLRRQGILEAIALPEAEVVAYGLRVYVQTLDRGASTTKWSQGLALEGDNKALIERELDFTVRAAIHKAAAGGCWAYRTYSRMSPSNSTRSGAAQWHEPWRISHSWSPAKIWAS
jgi:hypothetical protein